jgi:PAS domain S-box-containing protein
MNPTAAQHRRGLAQRLSEAQATIEALLSGQIDAVVDSKSATPVLLSKAQDALRQSEEQYRQIVEATTDGVVKLDAGERIVFVNGRLAEMLGYEPAQMIGMSISAFMGDSAKAILFDSLQRRRAEQDTLDTVFCHRNGTEISVNVAASPLVDSERRHIGTLGVVRDVTERKKLQSQLMVSDRMASVGTLAAGVAHEINNPLAAVIGNLDYVAEILGRTGGEPSTSANPGKSDAWLLEEIKGPINDAREAAARVRLIVRDLKIFSRSPIDEPKCRVDVQAVMESSLRMAWNEIRHRARLVKLYGCGVPNVEANEGRLGQVFLNLIVNAAQALPEGHAEQNEIRVSTRLHDGRVVIEVSDTGAGIPPEIIGRIFDAFFTTKGVGVGTGLGLAICHRIVADMDGELTVESAVGKGTTFRVALPIAGRAAIEEPAPPVEPIAIPGRRGRILVVDDEEIVLRSVQRLLSKEHDVVAVAKAKAALALCAGGETFDVILCDLMMPDMTGMDLHRELSRVAPEQAGRMIFMTGGAFTAKAWTFLSDPGRENVEKPFDPKTLRAIVRRHVQRDLQQSVTS